MRGDGGVAGEGRVVSAPKFHSRGKCTMLLRWQVNDFTIMCRFSDRAVTDRQS